MSSPSVSPWLTSLWAGICARAARPIHGIRLPLAAIEKVACATAEEALADEQLDGLKPHEAVPKLQALAATRALTWTAEERRSAGDHEIARDPEHLFWPRNPDFDALRVRDAGGALTARSWDVAVGILRQRARPITRGHGLTEEDAEDVLMQTLAELLQARTDGAPMDEMRVFEELPKFFANMIDRRTISWLRKRSARKRQAANPALSDSLNDPDNRLHEQLIDPASDSGMDRLQRTSYHRIRAACASALTPFEWHVIEALFVEGTHTRLDLASDAWVLEQMEMDSSASESKRRRALNDVIESALSRLGQALEEADL